MFGRGGGVARLVNIGLVESVAEKAIEPFDCDTAADPGRGLEGRLESIEEKVDRRLSQVGCER